MTWVAVIVSALTPASGSGASEPVSLSQNRCGVYALQICLESIGMPALADRAGDMLPGEYHSLADLARVGDAEKVSTLCLMWDDVPAAMRIGDAAGILPIVLPAGRIHFIAALQCMPDGRMLCVDFPHGAVWLSADDLRERLGWDGTLLYIGQDSDVRRRLLFHTQSSAWLGIAAAAPGLLILGLILSPATFRRCRKSHASIPHRRGLTILELLVVLAVIGVLVSLLMPAVQRARSAAEAVQCRNNLRQIGLAFHQYLDVYSRTPPSSEPFGTLSGDRVQQNLSAHVRLLPFLDQDPIYQRISFAQTGIGAASEPVHSDQNAAFQLTSIPVFECAADSVPDGCVSYRICYGTTPARHGSVGTTPPNSAEFGMTHIVGWPISQLTDGLSHTAAFSERVVGDFDAGSYTPWRDQALAPTTADDDYLPNGTARECGNVTAQPQSHRSHLGASWLFAGYQHTMYNHVLSPNSRTPDCWTMTGHQAMSARSLHPGGVHLLLGDGSVRFIGSSIDLATWRGLATISGGEVLSEY